MNVSINESVQLRFMHLNVTTFSEVICKKCELVGLKA